MPQYAKQPVSNQDNLPSPFVSSFDKTLGTINSQVAECMLPENLFEKERL